MQAGKLRNSIIIQQQSSAQDSAGQEAETWSTYATVWASIEPLVGREFYSAQQEQAEVNTKIRIRYKSGITPKMRVKFGTRIYDIKSIIDYQERNKEMILMCEEVVS